MAKVADVMRMEYMSSEESELDEETRRVKHYKTRKLSWESRELRQAKKKLDKSHEDSLPGLSRRVMLPREKGKPSTKPKPVNCPDWACVHEDPAQVGNECSNLPDGTPGNDAAVDLNISRLENFFKFENTKNRYVSGWPMFLS